MVSDYKETLCEYEVEELLYQIKGDTTKKILDIGCGTGDHISKLYSRTYDVVGLDQSDAMLRLSERSLQKEKKSKASPSSNKFRLVQGDMMNTNLFSPSSFDVCTSFYFSFYYSQKPKLLVSNVHHWLRPDGIWAIHLVDPEKFDPVLDAANPFVGFSLKKYVKENISRVIFNDMAYNSTFKYDPVKEIAQFNEEFVLPIEKKVRRHRQDLHMKSLQRSVEDICEDGKFKYKSHTDLGSRGYKNQYIFYFSTITS